MSILQRNKKVAVGVGVAAVAAAAIALGTGTYAAWTASATGPGGTLAAGTMSLVVGAGPSPATLFTASNLYPGAPAFTKSVTFKNDSPVDATLGGTKSFSDEVDGAAATTPDGANLKNSLTLASSCTYSGTTKTTPATPLKDVTNVVDPTFVIPAGKTATCTFSFALPIDAGNDVQGDKITVGSNFTLTQVTPAP